MVATSSRVAFGHSLRLLARNPAIVVPGLAIGALSAVVATLLEPADPLDSTIYTRLLQLVVQLVASILSIAFTTGMADAAWIGKRAALRDGARAFRRDAGHVFVAMLALFAIALVAAVLAAYTLSLSLLALVFYCIYTMPAAVVGERSGLRAVGESVEIAFRRPRTTLLVVAGIGLIAFAMGALAELVHGVPFVGPVVAAVVIQTVVAYFTLVTVGEYRALRAPAG
jgi:hypothetical protein